MNPRRRFAVLISGSGTNLQAILNALAAGRIGGELAVVLSNRPEAGGLARAQATGVPTEVLSHRAFATREAYDEALVSLLRGYDVDLVVLAGFMRILTPGFIRAFPERILNTHPSLLPAFPGKDAIPQTLAAGVKVSGCTLHFVEEAVDAGPIIAQVAVPVLETDDVDDLTARIQRVEHSTYPKVIHKVLTGQVRVEGRIVHVAGGGP